MMKPRILVLNAYSVDRVTDEINRQLKPSHHLYGVLDLKEAGYPVIYIEPTKTGFWYKLGTYVGRVPLLRVGDLGVQMEAFKRRKEFDVVYAPAQSQTMFLGVLSYFKIFNRKIIALAHHPLLRGKLGKYQKHSLHFAISGHAKWGALSNIVANEVNTIAKRKVAECFNWGPDVEYYDRINANLPAVTEPTVDIIAIGRTGRDYSTLVKAFNNTSVKVEIYCHKEVKIDLEPTENIKIFYLDKPESLSYPELIALYKNAKILAVPMFKATSLSGLTSVTDAIALGMPLFITENKFIEIDVEKEGFGHWLAPYDAEGWRAKAQQVLNNPDILKNMQERSRAVSASFNTKVYAKQLMAAIDGL